MSKAHGWEQILMTGLLTLIASQPFGIAEYKNPYSARDLTLHEACHKIKSFCLEMHGNGQVRYSLKRQHDYYYQIQCQCTAATLTGVTLSYEPTKRCVWSAYPWTMSGGNNKFLNHPNMLSCCLSAREVQGDT